MTEPTLNVPLIPYAWEEYETERQRRASELRDIMDMQSRQMYISARSRSEIRENRVIFYNTSYPNVWETSAFVPTTTRTVLTDAAREYRPGDIIEVPLMYGREEEPKQDLKGYEFTLTAESFKRKKKDGDK